jgi:hypothetical protein
VELAAAAALRLAADHAAAGFGLLVLCRILFGGFGKGGGGGPLTSKHQMCKSPEDKERFREDMRDRFHGERLRRGVGAKRTDGRCLSE